MKRILVATDFSTRSDRAIRRATLLARTFAATLTLVHVVDDDQPPRRARAERRSASALLTKLAGTLREVDGVTSDIDVPMGDAFEGILTAANRLNPDLIVIGAHRRHILRDVFVGTTAERTIRASRRPVLMANAVPAAPYRNVLVAVDFSEFSGEAVRAVARLGLEKHGAVSVLHVFDAPAAGPILRASLTNAEIAEYQAEAEGRAAVELAAFLREVKFAPGRRVLTLGQGPTADSIRSAAAEAAADLIVVGTHGRTGAAKLLLGSVTEELLRNANCDVMAVPPAALAHAVQP